MSWTGVVTLLGLFLLAFPHGDATAASAKRNVHFDHIKTGFPLTGAHVALPCETCHVQGTFKGTPKKCETCHTPGSRVQSATVKPSNHVPTNQACGQCHTSTASWKVARFTHVGVTPHQCGQCHNNSIAQGKPANHPVTNQPCDTCHRTTTWMSAAFTHLGVMPGGCASCHGSTATRKPANHIPTTLSCDACHTTGGSFTTSRFTHSATQGVMPLQCATCHNGSYTQWNALGKHAAHVATTASCDTCHSGYVSFAMAGSTFTHAGVTPGSCATCHVQGGTATTFKPANHIPTTLSCDACHSTGGTFTTSTFSHSATQGVIAGQCATCHNGSYTQWNALGKHATHVATTASCDTCHTGFATFAGAGFNHTGVTPGGCASCHNGSQATGKPGNHIPTTLSCDACHSTGGTFTTSTFTHSATQGVIAGQCSTCHNGSYVQWNALGKPANHVATTASCDTCHTGYVTFAGATFSHTGISPGTCSTCHYQGGPGLAAPTNHIPYQSQLLAGASMNCDACHKSTTSFASQTMNHNGSLGNGSGWCKGCHASGLNYLGSMEKKSLTHEKSTGVTDCSQSGCHRPLGTRGTPYSKW
ncbi:MAG: hypothetical protein AB1560_04640 [Pseudomonadota bacterium]